MTPEDEEQLTTIVRDGVRSVLLEFSSATVAFLSPRSMARRWDCSTRAVYRALAEMARDGYLRCVHIGSRRRIALTSIEEYERLHAHDRQRPRIARLPAPSSPEANRRQPGRGPAPKSSGKNLLAMFLAAARGEDQPKDGRR